MDHELRSLVERRAGGRCEYCHMPQAYDPLPFEIDHVIAQKHHGATVAQNLALACFHCDNHKGPNIAGRDPDSVQTVRLFDPRQDVWAEHFRWHDAILIGRTAEGRATVDVLAINLSHRVAHRESLMEEGIDLD